MSRVYEQLPKDATTSLVGNGTFGRICNFGDGDGYVSQTLVKCRVIKEHKVWNNDLTKCKHRKVGDIVYVSNFNSGDNHRYFERIW